MFTVTGGTYAYYALSASNNAISGITATVGLDFKVERILPSSVGVMVPQLEEYLGSAISTNYNCIDDNGNTVCQVYKATLTNTSTATVRVNGTIKFSGIDNMPNLKWKRITDERTIGEYTANAASTSSVIFEQNKVLAKNESDTYYFVIWIDETGESQTDSGTFRVTIEFNPANGGGLTSTIVPNTSLSYMTSGVDPVSGDGLYEYYRSDTYREKIKNVYFVKGIATDNSIESWDMTDLNKSSSGSVMAWLNTNTSDSNYYDLYIGADGIIVGDSFPYLFEGMKEVESIIFDNFDTSKTTSMYGMFGNLWNLTTLDVSSFDTSNVTDMSYMFYQLTSLETLDLSSFNTSNVTNMERMFRGTSNISSLNISSFDTSKVTNMEEMFGDLWNLTTLDVSSFDTSNVTNMSWMFNSGNFVSLDLSNFDTNNVTDMSYMFSGEAFLENLYLGNKFDTSNVTNMEGMFAYCNMLNTTLTIRNPAISDYDGMFDNAAIYDNSQIVVNYTSATSSLVDSMIATKSSNSNVEKGSLVS